MFNIGDRVKIARITGKPDSLTNSLVGKIGIVEYVDTTPGTAYPIYVDVSQVSEWNTWFFNEDELEIVNDHA